MRVHSQTAKMPEIENHVINNTSPEVKKGKVGAYDEYSHFNDTFVELYGAEKQLKNYVAEIGTGIKVVPPIKFRDGHQLFIGDGVNIGPWSFLGDGGKLVIGKNTVLGPKVQIHTIHHDISPEKRNYVHEKDITIGEDVTVGGGALVLASVGDGSIVVPGSVVTKDVPPGSVVVGNPARIVQGEEAEFYKRKLKEPGSSNGLYVQEIAAYKRLKQLNKSPDILHNAEVYLAEVIGTDKVGKNIKLVTPVFFDPKSEILLGNQVSIDVGVILSGRGRIKIGESSFIGPYGQIYTNNGQEVEIGKGVWIGGGSIILPDVKIGDGAIIVPGSVVTKNVPSGSVIVGNPGRIVQGEEAEFYKNKMAGYYHNGSKEEEMAAFAAFDKFNQEFKQLYKAEFALAGILGNQKVGKDIKVVPPVYCLNRNQIIDTGSHLNGGVVLRGESKIGKRVLIGPYTQMKDVVLEDDVWIGGSAIIMPGVKVGKGSVIGGGSLVVEDVPPNVVVVGNPAKVIKIIE